MIEAAVILLIFLVVYSYYDSKKRQASLSIENNRLAFLATISKNSTPIDTKKETSPIASKFKNLQTISKDSKVETSFLSLESDSKRQKPVTNSAKSKFIAIRTLSI